MRVRTMGDLAPSSQPYSQPESQAPSVLSQVPSAPASAPSQAPSQANSQTPASQASSQTYTVDATGGTANESLLTAFANNVTDSLTSGAPVMTWPQVFKWAAILGVGAFVAVKLRERGTI